MLKEINRIHSKDDFIKFLDLLAIDYKKHSEQWENQSIPEFLEQIASWVEDYSKCPMNDIDWEKINFKILAQIFYMGKIYE